MGWLKPCLSTSPSLGSVEYAVIELYDVELAASEPPGFDPVSGQPFLPDTDGDGIGERSRPGRTVRLLCKFSATKVQEQVQDYDGNDPSSLVKVTLYNHNLALEGLLTDGVPGVRSNDRLLRIENAAGAIRVDFEAKGREGLYCFHVRPGQTGDVTWDAFFEARTTK